MELDAARVAEAIRASVGQQSPGDVIQARPVGRGVVWSGTLVDSSGMPQPGGGWLVGPDGRTYSFSSNPGIHDFGLAVDLIEYAYENGLVDLLDPDLFSDRLKELTQRRSEDVRSFVRDLRSGALRSRSPRRLP